MAGSLAVEEIRAGVYTLTVSAPVEFLTDPTTVYPVTIDPTITSKDTMEASNIEDATVFSGYPNNNFGNYVFNTIGYQDATYGTGRVAVRLKALLNDATYQGLSAADIFSVLFYMKDGGSNYAYVNIHALTGNSTWTESTIKNSNLGTVSDTVYANGRMGGSAWTAFNLTTLVRDWKDGDQNGQCGFLMVNADSTKKIGALSCEYGSGDYWPYVVVEYTVSSVLNYSVKDIVEGTSFTLTANTGGVAADITWTSNNPTVATVSSSGVVTGINAGTAIITATSDVFTKPVNCVIYVTIEDGVYYIKNNQSNYYLSVQDAGVASGTPVLQQSKVTSDPARLAQLWKITHLGSTTYSIRPMHSLTRGLDVTGSKVDIYEIGEYDSLFSVPDYAEWTITYRDGGLVIQRGTDYSQAMAPTNLSGTVNNTLFVGTYTGATSAYRWSLEDPTVDVNDQLVMYDSREKRFVETGMAAVTERYVAPQETRTISNLEISASFVSVQTNEQDIRWYSNNTTIVAVDEYTGAVTGVSPGWTTVYAKQYGTTYTKSYTIIVTEIPEGTYFIRSKSSGKYADIKDQTMAFGAVIHQWEFHGGNTQRWEFTHLGDGTYTVCSANSGETVKYFLSVSGDSIERDQPVVLSTGSITSGMRWKISVTTSGAYKLTPLTGEANNRVLALAVDDLGATEENGDTLQQRDYVNDTNYKDEWELREIRYSANVYNFYDLGYPVRYGESSSAAAERINSYINAVSLQYLRLFNLELVSSAATYYQSPIDICKGTVTDSNIDTLCVHGDTVHTERSNVISSFLASKSDNSKTTYVLWSCHRITSTATNGDMNYNRSCSYGAGIFLIAIHTSERDKKSKGVLMHELNHQFGAKDHYHELADTNDDGSCKFKDICSECGDNPRPLSCIMYNSRIDISSDDVICSECQNDILAYLDEHYLDEHYVD